MLDVPTLQGAVGAVCHPPCTGLWVLYATHLAQRHGCWMYPLCRVLWVLCAAYLDSIPGGFLPTSLPAPKASWPRASPSMAPAWTDTDSRPAGTSSCSSNPRHTVAMPQALQLEDQNTSLLRTLHHPLYCDFPSMVVSLGKIIHGPFTLPVFVPHCFLAHRLDGAGDLTPSG